MNFRISIMLRFFCCLILLTSSINSLENDDDNSGEDETHKTASKNEKGNSIDDQLKRFSVELRQSKERDDLLTIEVGKIDEALHKLKSTVDEIKLQVNESDIAHDRRLSQLSEEINSFKKGNEKLKTELNAINEVLRKNKILEKPGIPFIDFHKCHKSFNIEKDEPTFTWTINDLKKKMMNQTQFQIESDIFPLKGYFLKAQSKLEYRYGYLSWSLSYKDSEKSKEDVINERLLPSVTYVFKNHSQLGHDNEVIITREAYPLVKGIAFNEPMKYDTAYYDYDLNWIYLRYLTSDTVVIDIYVESPEQAEQRCSDDGTLTWVIHDVMKLKELEKTSHVAFQASPYYYSSPKGYRMVALIKFQGLEYAFDAIGLTAFAFWIDGPYDDDLSTAFHLNSTFTFYHPTDSAKNIVRSWQYKSIGPFYEKITLSNEELESVLWNGSLYYHVIST